MKKISTLIAVVLFITATSFAQWGNGNHHNNDHDRNNGYGNNNDQYRIYTFRNEEDLLRDMRLTRQQEKRIDRINQQYRRDLHRIQFDRFTTAQQKRWALERLERERRRDILSVLNGYQRDRYNAWCSRNGYQQNTYGSNYPYNNGNGRW